MLKKSLFIASLILMVLLSACTSTSSSDLQAFQQLIDAQATLVAVQQTQTQASIPTEVRDPTATPLPEGYEIVFQATRSLPDPTNLIQNGYFLEDYDYWTRDLADEGGSSKMSITSSNNSIVDRALKMEHSGKGHLALSQRVPVENVDLEFSATFYTTSSEGLIFGFSGSGFVIIGLGYVDANGDMIGFTRIINVNESIFAGSAFYGAPESISDTNSEHNIMIESGELYGKYSIDVLDEINSNLLGINANDVKYIDVILLVGSNDKDAGSSLLISDIVLH